jgi:hypothetical protein
LAIAAGYAHTVALKTNGSVLAWGAGKTSTGSYPEYGQSIVPADLSGVTAIAAGHFHTVALKSDGSVVEWGNNLSGQTKVPVGLPPAFAIAAGAYSTVALVRDPPPLLTLARNADQTVSLSWTGLGALEQTESLTAPNWQPAPNQANPQTLSTTGAMKFFRVKTEQPKHELKFSSWNREIREPRETRKRIRPTGERALRFNFFSFRVFGVFRGGCRIQDEKNHLPTRNDCG